MERTELEDIETARLHNEVSRRGLNGDSPGLRVRGRASPFLRAFAVPMRFAVGAGSNKRTVGRFSFCGLSPDPYSLPVSLFRGGGGGCSERASVILRLCTVPQVLPSRKEPWRSRELFLSRCLANRRGVAAFRSTNGGIIILSISRAHRRYAGDSSDSERCARVGLAWETPS